MFDQQRRVVKFETNAKKNYSKNIPRKTLDPDHIALPANLAIMTEMSTIWQEGSLTSSQANPGFHLQGKPAVLVFDLFYYIKAGNFLTIIKLILEDVKSTGLPGVLQESPE